MLGPLTTICVFNDVAEGLIAASSVEVQSMCNWLTIFGAFAAVLFFGWGFDGCRSKTEKTWMILAGLCLFMSIWNSVSSNFMMVPLLVGMMSLAEWGGFTLFLCHMLFESGNSEVACTSAFLILWSVGKIISFTFFVFTTSVL